MKNDVPLKILSDFPNFVSIFKQGASRVLPPAGQIFEKWHPLEHVERFSEFVLQFSSRVLAGVLPLAGQIFEKWHFLGMFDDFPFFP